MALSRAVANLAVSVTARINDFMRKFRRVQRRLRRTSRAINNLAQSAKRMSVALGGIAIAAGYAFGRMAAAGEQFSRKMNRSLAIVQGQTLELRQQMRATAIDVARNTIFSANQAAESYFFLASAGLNAKQSLAALPTVAKFGQAGMFDMAMATDLLTDAQSALGLKVLDASKNLENMTRIGDVLVKANTLANASVEQFSTALTTKAGAALKFLNKDVEEGVAVLAAFADQGLKGSDAGTALNIVLRDLSTKAIVNAKAFKANRIAVYDSNLNMRNMANIVADIEDRLRGMSDAQAKATLLSLGFSDKSVIFLQTLLGTSRMIAAYEAALRRAGGTMERVANKQLTPFEKAVARLGAAWTELSLQFTPVVTGIAGGLTFLSERMQELTRFIRPEVITFFLKDVLNRFDIFFHDILGKSQLFAAGLLDTVEQMVNGIGKILAYTHGIEPPSVDFQPQVDRLTALAEGNRFFVDAANRGLAGKVGFRQLWGDQFAEFIQAPINAIKEQLKQDRLIEAQDGLAMAMERLRFEWARIKNDPVGFLEKIIGLPLRPKFPIPGDDETAGTGLISGLSRISIGAGPVSPLLQAVPGAPFGSKPIEVMGMDTLIDEVQDVGAAIGRLDLTPRVQ